MTLSNRPFNQCDSPRKRRERKWAERIFEEIMSENFPNLMKDINREIIKIQRTSSTIHKGKK